MANESKRKLLFITLVLSMLFISSTYAALIPNAHAAQITTQEKGLSILSNVVGFDLSKYSATTEELPQDSYLGVVPQENVRYTLETNGSKADMLYTFANGNLRMIHVLESKGSPQLTKTAIKPIQLGNATLQVIDVLGTAKGFLNDYQSYSGKSFYGELRSMLENVDASKNLTKTSGNVKLEVNGSEGSTTFRWTYTFNGIEAPDKCIALGYQDGFLKYFIDNWDLYKIGSTTVNLSEKEAIDIAMEHARAFSWNMGSGNDTVKIMNFKVTNAMIWENVFCSNLYADKARSEEPLMLYPVRHVWVSLDKFYPGNVYGFNVYVWADTGEICYIHERVSTLDPPADLVAAADDFTVAPLNGQVSVDEVKSNSVSLTWTALPAFAAVMLGTVPVWFLLGKKKNLLKRSSKIGGILFCLLISSAMLLVPISAVNAEYTRGALIWGSRSIGAWNDTLGFSWRKTPDEVNRQITTSNAISNYFKDDGYDTKNYEGNGSVSNMILANISDSAAQHSLVAVVDFDHGVGNIVNGEFHYMFEDNNGAKVGPVYPGNASTGNAVYDVDIYDRTGEGKNFFAFISTCMSANVDEWEMEDPPGSGNYYSIGQGFVNGTHAQGMPFAWTHRIVASNPGTGEMSDDGYGDPDGGAFCYIGFPMGSAALDQTISGIAPIYATWLENFFWYALSFDISVNAALDEASLRNFNNLFGDTDLATGFTAVWPMYYGGSWHNGYGYGSTLAVYGNGNIHLYEYFVHDVVWGSGQGIWGIYNGNGLKGGSNDNNFASLYVAYYDSQAMIIGSLGWEATGHIYLYGYSGGGYYSELYVYASYDCQNWEQVNTLTITDPLPYWIDIGTPTGKFRYIAIVVYCNDWWDASYLFIDSVLVIPEPKQDEYYYVYNTTSYVYGGIVNNPDYLNGSYTDGNFAQVYCANSPDMAVVTGSMNKEAHGDIEIYGYSGVGYYSNMTVYVSENYQNWEKINSLLITANSPYWINFGYADNFKYIRIVGYDNGYSVDLHLDCVRVTP